MFLSKRVREDGQFSREEYGQQQLLPSEQGGSSFARADPQTLSSRRILTAPKRGRNEECARHIKALNASFISWFREELKSKPHADLAAGSQDYSDYMSQINNRYLKTHGEVLTFGSGDCGQLAHGTEEEEDLLVKYPRVVYSLR